MRLRKWLPSSNLLNSRTLPSLTPLRLSISIAIVLEHLPLLSLNVLLVNHKTIYHTFTSGYDPQANGTAERAVGLIKSLAARVFSISSLDASYWSYAVIYASQSLLCHALHRRQWSLPFGILVVAQVLNYKDIRFSNPRTISGRLLFWDHLSDQVSYIICPPGEESLEPFVYKAGLPARLPPAVNIDDLGGPSPLPSSFDTPLHDKNLEDQLHRNPLDLDPLP